MLKNLSFFTRLDSATGQPALSEGKRKIFFSYKHSDEEALPLCKKLADCILDSIDVAIWYDHRLTAGKEYDDEIKRAIMQSDVFVLILTPNILSSKYVIEEEIPFAIKNQVAIIPVIAGADESDIPKIEKLIGRVHMPLWFFGKRDELPSFSEDSKEQFINGLKLGIANKDLISEAQLFYEKGYQNLSLRHLTPEQVFIKAYGSLFCIDESTDKSIGIKLMDSILGMYDGDKEFTELQEQVACELLKHFFMTGQTELFLSYMKSALSKKYAKVLPLLFEAYYKNWHPEVFCYETELSFKLFEHLYQRGFEQNWDADKALQNAASEELKISPLPTSNEPRIGELIFEGHTAYFKRIENQSTVALIVDDRCLAQYKVYASYGDVYSLFMTYDAEHKMLIVLHSDFDHYGPETCTMCRMISFAGEGIRISSYYSDWQRGLRKLPYHPYIFNIK